LGGGNVFLKGEVRATRLRGAVPSRGVEGGWVLTSGPPHGRHVSPQKLSFFVKGCALPKFFWGDKRRGGPGTGQGSAATRLKKNTWGAVYWTPEG